MFEHPISQKLLEVKWKRFGLMYFMMTQFFFAVLVALFTEGYLHDIGSCHEEQIVMLNITGILALFAVVMMLYIMCCQIMRRHTTRMSLLGWEVPMPVPRLMHNPWQVFRFASVLMICASCITSPCDHLLPEHLYVEAKKHSAILRSITALFLYVQILQALVLSEELSAIVFVIGKLSRDIARNLFVILIFLMSFAAALTALDEHDTEFISFGDSSWALLRMTTSAGHPPVEDLKHPFGAVLVIAYLIITGIGMLSILVAQLTYAYQQITADQAGFAKKNRAYVCVEVESVLPLSYRKKMYDEYNFGLQLEFDNGDQVCMYASVCVCMCAHA
jgi:hypothetical protein